MGKEFFDAFLLGAIATSALMAVIWLLRTRSKGATAYLMAGAFLSFGAMSFVLRSGGPSIAVWTLAALLACLLFADFAVRAGREAKDRAETPPR